MFGGSDEFVLREILGNVDHIKDLYYQLVRSALELEYANDLKEYELGIIDVNEFNQRRNAHYNDAKKVYNKATKR